MVELFDDSNFMVRSVGDLQSGFYFETLPNFRKVESSWVAMRSYGCANVAKRGGFTHIEASSNLRNGSRLGVHPILIVR